MATITGGKATVLRAMAQKTADVVCHTLGIDSPCRTADFVLPSWRQLHQQLDHQLELQMARSRS